jgi:excisionase family DNA binding protein
MSPATRLNSVEVVMKRLHVGRSKVFELIATGQLRSVKVGRRRLISDAAIEEFIARIESEHSTGGAA